MWAYLVEGNNMDTLFENLSLTSNRSLLAIAPHPDDIALSCGGLIRRLQGIEITLLTCFSQSIYAPLADVNSLAREIVYKIRREEDEEYCRRNNLQRVDLKLEDVTIRYPNDTDWIQETPELDETFLALSNLMKSIIDSKNYSVVLCPLSIGDHVDHYFVNQVIFQNYKSEYQIFFYEDLPYGSRIGGAEVVLKQMKKKYPNSTYREIDITSVFDSKLDDITLYKSQIYQEDLTGVINYSLELGHGRSYVERLWSISE